MPHSLPGKTLSRPSHVKADEVERVGSRSHLIEPLGQEVGVVRLASQTADLVANTVDGDDRLWLDAAKDRLASHMIVQTNRRPVGRQAKRTPH